MLNSINYRRPWVIGLIVVGIVLAIDIPILAPWVSWEHEAYDSGDLICSAYFLGIPHPTGYPTYCMLAKLFQTIIPFGSIAWRTNLFSAVCSALACGIIAMTLHRVLWTWRKTAQQKPDHLDWALPVTGGIILALSRTFLSQSIITEVYPLNALLVSIDLMLVLDVSCLRYLGGSPREIRRVLIWLSFTYPLTLTNHLSSAFIFPLILSAFVVGRKAFNIRMLLYSVAACLAGLLPYLYLPIRSAANPPFDWGNPETLNGFIWVVTGTQFKHLFLASFDYQVLYRLLSRFKPMVEMGLIFSMAAAWGTTVIFSRGIISRAAMTALGLVVLNLYPVINYHIGDTESFLLPTFIGLSMLAVLGIRDLITRLPRSLPPWAGIALLGVIFATGIPALKSNISYADLSHEERPHEYANNLYDSLPERAILVETFYGRAFTMWYKDHIEPGEPKKDIAVIYSEHLMFDWGIESMSHRYPWIKFPAPDLYSERAVASLAELNAGELPFFVSREMNTLKGKYEFIPYGEVFLLKPLSDDTPENSSSGKSP